MHVILTHEQADFDAVAAELGAYLLNEGGIAVLPRRLNRNVRSFISLYGAELPFVEARDLPQDSIELVTLVDTQSLVTLRGMNQKMAIQVVDHHQQRPDLPDGWSISIERLGACTTMFVENLQEHNGALSSVHASLLLLGIYEDTGSLTFASTTVRDVRAAAYLMEQGASLRIIADYLNPPLSPEQRQLSDRLLNASQTHHINGQNIVVASANGTDVSEEISTIAHKLRDLLDPDALFLLVTTSDGVRLVARSTNDQIDVSAVAAHFGGGGHERAAAALIKSTAANPQEQALQLEQVTHEMIEILPRIVRPSITVGSIMSRQPRLLSPETPARDAHQLMQRYGYEGYPVIKDGHVVGLLTRRSVDRALNHKLNLPAASLMEAGDVTVQPQDALEHLQRVMMSSGWGQVPVVDPHSGTVIGIVTRTDLLKTLAGSKTQPAGKQNLASRLEAALPAGKLALLQLIADQAREQHMAVYIVGGFVRDLIIDHPSIDFDIVVEGDAIALARTLVGHYGGRITSHSRFGTAKWQIADAHTRLLSSSFFPAGVNRQDLPENLDLISARTEFYDYPTALPTVERSSIKLDLHRRDFTINTLALRLDGRHYGDLYDYWNGLSDLRSGLVRVLHSLSFVDDPTRLLRAVRFEQRFGFQIESRTRELMDGALELVNNVSGDRLRHELNLILAEEKATAMLSRLESLGMLSAIHPDLNWKESLSEPLQRAIHAEIDPEWELPEKVGHHPLRQMLAYLVWLGQMPAVALQGIGARLRFSRNLQAGLEILGPLWKELHELRGASPSRITALLDPAPMVVLYAISLLEPTSEVKQMLESYARLLRRVQPYTSGDNLRTLISPGPAFREILWHLRAAWLDGTITSKEEEQVLLEELLRIRQEGT